MLFRPVLCIQHKAARVGPAPCVIVPVGDGKPLHGGHLGATVAEVLKDSFSVSVIPHTAKETILSQKKLGDTVNLENDLVGKYVEKLLNFNHDEKPKSRITREFLANAGF